MTTFLSTLAFLCGLFAIGFTLLAVITIIADLRKESKKHNLVTNL